MYIIFMIGPDVSLVNTYLLVPINAYQFLLTFTIFFQPFQKHFNLFQFLPTSTTSQQFLLIFPSSYQSTSKFLQFVNCCVKVNYFFNHKNTLLLFFEVGILNEGIVEFIYFV